MVSTHSILRSHHRRWASGAPAFRIGSQGPRVPLNLSPTTETREPKKCWSPKDHILHLYAIPPTNKTNTSSNLPPQQEAFSWPKRPTHLLHYPKDHLPNSAGGESKERQNQGAAPEQRGYLGTAQTTEKQEVLDIWYIPSSSIIHPHAPRAHKPGQIDPNSGYFLQGLLREFALPGPTTLPASSRRQG